MSTNLRQFAKLYLSNLCVLQTSKKYVSKKLIFNNLA
jgi:hypothetical protein